jgi:hypothetical protein
MRIIETPYLTSKQIEVIYKLWNQEYPEKLTYKTLADFDSYLNTLNDINHYLFEGAFGKVEG